MTLSTSAVAVCCCNEFAQLIEQPRVLDGDDGLRCEVFDQLNLLVGERTDLLAKHTNCANEFAFLEHWHDQIGPRARDFDEGNNAAVFPDVGLIGPKVGNVNNLFGICDAIERDFRIIAQVNHRIAPPRIGVSPLLWTATERKIGPSHRNRLPNVASQMRVAFSSIALKTGSSSPGDELNNLQHLRGCCLLL